MASSGSFSGSICSGHYVLRIDWSQAQNVSANTSTITAKIYLVNDWRLDIGARTANTISIGGTSQGFTSPAITTTGEHLLNTVTQTVTHESDGSKSISISAVFSFAATISGTYYSTISASANITLDSVPRASDVSICSDYYHPGIQFFHAHAHLYLWLSVGDDFDKDDRHDGKLDACAHDGKSVAECHIRDEHPQMHHLQRQYSSRLQVDNHHLKGSYDSGSEPDQPDGSAGQRHRPFELGHLRADKVQSDTHYQRGGRLLWLHDYRIQHYGRRLLQHQFLLHHGLFEHLRYDNLHGDGDGFQRPDVCCKNGEHLRGGLQRSFLRQLSVPAL